MRVLLWVGVFASAIAWGQERPIAPTDCDDSVAECKEDCAIKWGGTTNLKMRAKLNPCINKCSRTELDCRETFFETKRNNLDEGAISGSPTSRDVDADGLPTKTAQKKPVEKKDDDIRDEPEPKPVAEAKKEPEARPAYELKKEETPKSNRTELKAEKPKAEPKPEPKAEPVIARDEPKASPPVAETRAEEPAPPPKKGEKREEPKKKDEKKKRALDEWDPDAL